MNRKNKMESIILKILSYGDDKMSCSSEKLKIINDIKKQKGQLK